jgi:hypothetical protein
MPDLRKPENESDFYFVEADDPETSPAANDWSFWSASARQWRSPSMVFRATGGGRSFVSG